MGTLTEEQLVDEYEQPTAIEKFQVWGVGGHVGKKRNTVRYN